MLRVITFIKALFWHIYSGSPKSTKTEILNRYLICKLCEEFNSDKNQCNVCGCNINLKKQFLNKLAWADQKCPIGKWDVITKD